jgi:DNA-binding NarL/FixJ family response regulator
VHLVGGLVREEVLISPTRPAPTLDQLTAREREVLILVGEGYTNNEIARMLYVGEGTIKTHINHVFTKLGLRDRAAAIIFAYDNDLITRPE